MRYPLVDGQGNFGSVDGDPAAAMRYTEARLREMGELMLADIDEDTVEWGPNFDESLKEPAVIDPLFRRYAALGNSITAGFQSAGINDSTQRRAYPVLLAMAMGTDFTYHPSLLEEFGATLTPDDPPA